MSKREFLKLALLISFVLSFAFIYYTGFYGLPDVVTSKTLDNTKSISHIDISYKWFLSTSEGFGYPFQSGFGDIDGDGNLEIITFYSDYDGYYLACIDGVDGSIKWKFKNYYVFVYQPLVIDVNGDGVKEIVAGDEAGNLFLLNGSNGTPLWNITVNGAFRSPIIPYVFNDELHFVFGTKSGLYSVNKFGELNWSYMTNSSVRDVTVGFVNEDEIMDVIGIDSSSNIYVLDGASGQVIWSENLGLPTDYPYLISKIYFGDFDRDGVQNILITWVSIDGVGVKSIVASNGKIVWETSIGGFRLNGVICDIDGDNELEFVAIPSWTTLYILDLNNGRTHSFDLKRSTEVRSLTVGDFDGDSQLEIFAPPFFLDYVGGIWITKYFDSLSFGSGDGYYTFAADVDGNGDMELLIHFDNMDTTLMAVDLSPSVPFRVYWNGPNGDVNGSKSLSYIDPDGDFISTSVEVSLGSNYLIADSDGDSLPDGWEVKYGLNPLVADSSFDLDKDGLSNLDEYLRGTNPTSKDSDSDGLSDSFEVLISSSPVDPGDPLYTRFVPLFVLVLLVWGYKSRLFSVLKLALVTDWQRFKEYRRRKRKEWEKQVELQSKRKEDSKKLELARPLNV